MTTEHTDALRKAVAAHKAVTDAVQAESQRIADERAKQAGGDVAVHPSGSTAGQKEKGNA